MGSDFKSRVAKCQSTDGQHVQYVASFTASSRKEFSMRHASTCQPPIYGLCLASGGARGAYQAGALVALAERGERYDRIIGTSIGALNGAFYAQSVGSVGA